MREDSIFDQVLDAVVKHDIVPERGGNSNSFSEMPAVAISAFENTTPGYCVVTVVPLLRFSKSITAATAAGARQAETINAKRTIPKMAQRLIRWTQYIGDCRGK